MSYEFKISVASHRKWENAILRAITTWQLHPCASIVLSVNFALMMR